MLSSIKDVVDSATSLADLWRKRAALRARTETMLRLLLLEARQNIDLLGMSGIERDSALASGDPAWARLAAMLGTAAHEAAFLSWSKETLRRPRSQQGIRLPEFLSRPVRAVAEEDEGISVALDVPAEMLSRGDHPRTVIDSLRFICTGVRSLARISECGPETATLFAGCSFSARLKNIRAHELAIHKALRDYLSDVV
jgi:hypothetical protein